MSAIAVGRTLVTGALLVSAAMSAGDALTINC
jgi:hypothetical protein